MQRRTFTKLLASTTVGITSAITQTQAQVRQIRMTESGGSSGDSIDAAYIKPFTAKTGIKVVRDNPNELGKLRAIVESHSSSVVLFELGAANLEQAKALGLVQKLDWTKIAPMPLFPEAKDDYGLGYQYYATIMSWRKGQKAPKSWADFFNAKDFPGKRTIPSNPAYVLPAVLLASGVSVDKLYPLDVDLAFRKLEEIKDQVSVWWKSGAQAPQLLRDNEIQYAMAFSGRVVSQPDLEFTFNQSALMISYICIVAGARPEDVEVANRLLYEMSVPENQLVATEIIPYTGGSPALEKMLPKQTLNQYAITSENRKLEYLADNTWWFKNADMVQKRWQEFVLKL